MFWRVFRLNAVRPALGPIFAALTASEDAAEEYLASSLQDDPSLDIDTLRDWTTHDRWTLANALLLIADTVTTDVERKLNLAKRTRTSCGPDIGGTKMGAAFYAGANAARHFMEWEGNENPHEVTEKILKAIPVCPGEDSCYYIM